MRLRKLPAERSRAQLQVEKLDQAISDRVFEQFGNIRSAIQSKTNNLSGFATKNGAGSESEMSEGWEGNKASRGSGENEFVGRQAHHVGIGPQNDCCRSKNQTGEDSRGAKESGLSKP